MTPRRFLPLGVIALLVGACSSSGTTEDTPDTTPAEDTLDTSIELDTNPPPDDGIDTNKPDTTPGDTGGDVVTETLPDVPDTAEVSLKCSPSGKVETKDCGKCGTQSRLCLDGLWGDYGICEGETGVCIPGTKGKVTCGKCGTRDQVCQPDCTYLNGPCTDEGLCASGEKEVQYSTLPDGATLCRARTCATTCIWGAFSAYGPGPC